MPCGLASQWLHVTQTLVVLHPRAPGLGEEDELSSSLVEYGNFTFFLPPHHISQVNLLACNDMNPQFQEN